MPPPAGQAFDRIAYLTAEAIETRLALFHQLFYRLFLPPLVFPLVMSAASLFRVIFSAW